MEYLRAGRLLPVAGVVLLALTSCGVIGDTEDSEETTEAGTAEDDTAEDQQPPDEEDGETDGAEEPEEDEAGEDEAGEVVEAQDGSQAPEPEDAIASIEYEGDASYEGSDDDSITASVVTLEEVDGIVLMEVFYRPHLSSTNDTAGVYDMIGGQASRSPGVLPQIYDRENLKIYSAFHQNGTLSAAGSPTVSDGEAIYWWGYFPPFEDDVDTVDIRFAQERSHLEDVPVQ